MSAQHLIGQAAIPSQRHGGRQDPVSRSHRAGCSNSNWFCSDARFPVRIPTSAQHSQGRKAGGCSCTSHQHQEVTDCCGSIFLLKLGNSEGRRNFRSARTTVGMLTAIAAIFLRPGWWNVLRASKYDFPSPSQLGCFPRSYPDVCTEDHHWHNTPAAEQVWTMRSSENNSVFLCSLPPQCAVQGAKGAVLLLLLFSKLNKNLFQCCLRKAVLLDVKGMFYFFQLGKRM